MYLRGTIKFMPSANANHEAELQGAIKAVRQKDGIRDVIVEAKFHGEG